MTPTITRIEPTIINVSAMTDWVFISIETSDENNPIPRRRARGAQAHLGPLAHEKMSPQNCQI